MDRKGFLNYSDAVRGERPRQPLEDFCLTVKPTVDSLVKSGEAVLHQRLDGGEDFEMVIFQREHRFTDQERIDRAREELKMIAFSAKFDGNGDSI